MSRRCEEIDIKVKPFLDRPIEGEWPYLWTEATYLKVRRGLSGVKLVISDAHESVKASVSKVLNATWQRAGFTSCVMLWRMSARAARSVRTSRLAREVGSVALSGKVMAVNYRDMAYAVTVRLDAAGTGRTVQISSDTRMRLGERIGLEIVSERLGWFLARTQAPVQ